MLAQILNVPDSLDQAAAHAICVVESARGAVPG